MPVQRSKRLSPLSTRQQQVCFQPLGHVEATDSRCCLTTGVYLTELPTLVIICTLLNRQTMCRFDLFWHFHVAHALIYGVIQSYWTFVLRQPKSTGVAGEQASHIIIPNDIRKLMSQRVQTVSLKSTGCISGRLPDITRCTSPKAPGAVECDNFSSNRCARIWSACRESGDMTMSDWIIFLRVVSPIILHNAGVNEDVLRLWEPLRKGAMYFLDYREGQHQPSLIDAAQNYLCQYAYLAERLIPDTRLSTVQLHCCVVHLAEHVRLYGPSAFRTEFWVERMMQTLKRITKYRTMNSPELVAVAAWLLKRALGSAAVRMPPYLDLWRKIDPYAARDVNGDRFDDEGNALTSKLVDENGAVSDKVPFPFSPPIMLTLRLR